LLQLIFGGVRGDSQESEFYVQTFRNTLTVPSS